MGFRHTTFDARTRPSRLSSNHPHTHAQVYKIHDKLYMGLAGLGTDAQTL
jgi:20S proteasome alpha/beta subunit